MSKDFLTIAEYAKIKGISTAAVYKRLKTSLQPFITIVNGKKCLLSTVLEDSAERGCQPSCKPVVNQLSTVDNPAAGAVEAALAALQKQLQEKDKQIEKLQEEAAEMRRTAAEKDKFIQEQSTRLSVLLEQSQELQRNNQILLGYSASKAPPEPSEPPTTENGFFKKIFRIFKK